MYKESGIYCYRNKINGKLYIGQAKDLRSRYLGFLRKDRRYSGILIDNARKKYGIENFEYSILTHCPINELNYWENYYIERLKTVRPNGYNMTNGGDSVYTSTKEYKNIMTEKLKKTILSKNPTLDVSKVYYESNRSYVTITCPIHGEFKKTPSYFNSKEINDLCCPKCVRENIRKTTEKNFFKEAKKKWGDKYDYSKTIIIDRVTPITITCPIHGDFTVLPGNHICKDKNSGGCSKCSKKKSHDELMEKGRSILLSRIHKKFGDKYSLDKFVYRGDKEKVTLICPKHGEFSMRVGSLLKSRGCPKCSGFYMDRDFFIEKATGVHGNKYDYSKVKFKTTKEPVCIICPEHGEFWQTPRSHMDGSGCPKCSYLKRTMQCTKTTEQFIKEAKETHGNKYDYSKVEYIDSKTKVCIICPEHGEFWQAPSSHLSGCGCRKCSKNAQKKTTEQFIKEAKEIHGDKYDYSKVEYINNRTKVCIICPKHGEFWQTPESHLSGCGCRKCYKEGCQINPNEKFINKVDEIYPNRYTFEKCNYRNKTTLVTLFDKNINEYVSIEPDYLIRRKPKTAELIRKLKEKFGNVYDYSKVEYITDKTKICIICPKHGEFWMTYRNLLNSKGCPKCTKENIFKNKYNGKDNESVFIRKSRETHGDKYDYSKVKYVNSHTKVCIICPEHGEFWQTPYNHLHGYGCSKCGYYRETKDNNSVKPTILQLTKDNVLVKEWNDISDIHKAKPITSTKHITKCLQGKFKTAGGFIWKYNIS